MNSYLVISVIAVSLFLPLKSLQKADTIYVPPEPKKVQQTAVVSEPDDVECSCIKYARSISDFQPPILGASGTPLMIKPNNKAPIVGGWVLFSDPPLLGHAAIVMSVGTNTIKVVEGNYKRCEITTRILLKDNPLIRGYFY